MIMILILIVTIAVLIRLKKTNQQLQGFVGVDH